MLQTAKDIVQKLHKNGFEAYYAGGAVRDMLLGLLPKDVDIVTSANPDEIEDLFEKTYPIGKKFGIILVHENGHEFEIATFRSDSGYSDGRRPDYVTFSSAEEDAMRRDFTVNGMFYDPIKEEVLDFVGGQKDLDARVIRFIGDPETRIKEDHLRLLRTVRFAHQIGGQYEPATYYAVRDHANLIQGVSWERIRDEVNKMLLSPTRANALEDLQDLGLLHEILPEVENMKGVAQPFMYHKEGSVWNHVMNSLASLKGKRGKNLELIWATLLHDIGKPQTFKVEERVRFDGHAEASRDIGRSILTRLRFPKKTIETILWAIEHHMSLFHLTGDETSQARKIQWFKDPKFPLLMDLHRADVSGTTPSDLTFYKKLKEERRKALAALPKKLPKLISGEEIMELLSIKAGKEVGEILERVHEAQLEGKIQTENDAKNFVLSL